MPQPLRVVDNERPHPRDLARRAVKEFRLDKDDPERPLPIVNTVDSGAPLLLIDEVIKRTERIMYEEGLRPRYHVNFELFIKAVLVLLVVIGLVELGKLIF